jgi:hypothetical protein
MSKKSASALMALALAATTKNIVKSRGASGKSTYLDRFVDVLVEDGVPTEAKDRNQIVAEISLAIALEQRADEQAMDASLPDFELTPEGDTEDDIAFAVLNKKVKNQVAAAIANCQNSTSLSYNDKYKDVWSVVKEGNKVSLAPVE